MSNYIVTVNVSQTLAATPNALQKMGAFISCGGTDLAPEAYSLLTQESDLTAILAPAVQISTAVWATNEVTYTTSGPHGFAAASTIDVVISGMAPAGYNGYFTATITGADTFTVPLANDPGVASAFGSVVTASQVELVTMATTFFAQGSDTAVYVLELGALGVSGPTGAPAALNTWIQGTPRFFYSYLLPRNWANDATDLQTLFSSYQATTAKTYFFTTFTLANYTSFTNPALNKCVVGLVEAPTVAAAALTGTATEFSLASVFYVTLHYSPSSSNKVTPLCFSELVGVTPYPVKGNQVLFAQLKSAFINFVDTGAEGGISNAILKWGVTWDGKDFTYWYSVDWVQINIDLQLSNAIINGSNNPQNPLYYDQNGINRLKAVAQTVMTNAVSFGLALSPVVVTAVPFATYVEQNPGDYPKGAYNGLAVTYTPATGFKSITFNVQVSQIPLAVTTA